MRHLWNVGPMHDSVVELHSGHLRGVLLHALLSRHLREFLLSTAVILAISLFTVATIVLMVTTVNSSISTTDMWSRWTSSPVMSIDEGGPATAGLTLRADVAANTAYPPDWAGTSQADAGYAALPAPGQ